MNKKTKDLLFALTLLICAIMFIASKNGNINFGIICILFSVLWIIKYFFGKVDIKIETIIFILIIVVLLYEIFM